MRKKKNKRKGLRLKNNKLFFGTFGVLFAFILIINATFAWTSYTEWVKNHFQSNPEAIKVEIIEEKYDPSKPITLSGDPDGIKDKDVKVKNMSSRTGIIRVQLKESFMPFKLDLSDGEGKGNGKLALEKNTASKTEIDLDNKQTWKKDNVLDSGKKDGSDALYYTAVDPDNLTTLASVIEQPIKNVDTTRNSFLKKYIQLNLSTEIYTSIPANPSGDYWLYQEDSSGTPYFYYSRSLKAGEMTDEILHSLLVLDKSFSNRYKGALYHIDVEAEGKTATFDSLKSWAGDESSDIYKMLEHKVTL